MIPTTQSTKNKVQNNTNAICIFILKIKKMYMKSEKDDYEPLKRDGEQHHQQQQKTGHGIAWQKKSRM